MIRCTFPRCDLEATHEIVLRLETANGDHFQMITMVDHDRCARHLPKDAESFLSHARWEKIGEHFIRSAKRTLHRDVKPARGRTTVVHVAKVILADLDKVIEL